MARARVPELIGEALKPPARAAEAAPVGAGPEEAS
jgi:hypothetical protein